MKLSHLCLIKNCLKKIGKIVKCFFLILLSVLLLGVLVIFIVNKIATAKEMSMLEKEGYLKLVSVGDYSLNVYDYGNWRFYL